jgi:protein SCO1/2
MPGLACATGPAKVVGMQVWRGNLERSRGLGLRLLLTLLAGWLAGCSGETVYDVRGVVRELRPAEREVVIRHEVIPGYMQAMTMPFPVRDAALIRGLKPGDVVTLKLHVLPKESWADQFTVLSNVPPTVAEAPPKPRLNDTNAVSFYADVPELKRGDLVPDYRFTNQLGKVIRVHDYRGQVLVLNFIFTRCPLPDFCPRASDHFAATIRLLKERPAVPRNWKFLSLSFDPLYDTPEVLTAYGKRYGADGVTWALATGSFDQLQPLGSHFGLYFAREVTPDLMNHNLRTVVVDPQGRVAEILIGKDWTPEQLATAVAAAAAVAP